MQRFITAEIMRTILEWCYCDPTYAYTIIRTSNVKSLLDAAELLGFEGKRASQEGLEFILDRLKSP